MKKESPSIDQWLKEAKAHDSAPKIGMYLTHNGTVRQTAKAKVRYGEDHTKEVTGMIFSYDEEKVNAVIADTIYFIIRWQLFDILFKLFYCIIAFNKCFYYRSNFRR